MSATVTSGSLPAIQPTNSARLATSKHTWHMCALYQGSRWQRATSLPTLVVPRATPGLAARGTLVGEASADHVFTSARLMSAPTVADHAVHATPPQIGEEIPTNRRTNRRTDFSAKQAPSALDLSPRPLTHLPYGCSIVAFMWKGKISLKFQKKNFVSRPLHGPSAVV